MESSVVSACLRYLAYKRVFAWRNNSGGFKPEKGRHFIRFGFPGSPDIIAVVNGQFVGIEVKFGKGKLSDSQVAFRSRLEEAGGKYLVVYSVEELDNLLKTLYGENKENSEEADGAAKSKDYSVGKRSTKENAAQSLDDTHIL